MYLFVTNREIITKNHKEQIREDGNENAGDNLRFGAYNFNTKRFVLYPEPENELELSFSQTASKENNSLKGSVRFFNEIYTELIKDTGKTSEGLDKGDVLFFIHGFNTDLDGVRNAFKNLKAKYIDNPSSPINHIVIFTWPGRSPIIPYHYFDDKKDAIRSGEALARGIKKIINFFKVFLVKDDNKPCNRKIHMIVHSMGHRVLKHCMLEMHNRNMEIPEIFGEIILMAADIEYDIFEKEEAFNKLIDFGNRIHIYFHQNDFVLDISKYTKNFSNRLGKHGRKRIDTSLAGVTDVDITETSDDDGSGIEAKALNHWYYYTSSEVINDVITVLNGRESKYKV
ncbi:MAG: alpha/beta hydrolase [Bacteroidetes bacterium]|nr:alpha/beta hydrolase [Bacteroidota bacterium]